MASRKTGPATFEENLAKAIVESDRLKRETNARIEAAHPKPEETPSGTSVDEGAKDVDTSTVFNPHDRVEGPWKKYADEDLAAAQNGLDKDLAALGAAPDGGGGKAWRDIPPESLVSLNAAKEKANKQGDKLAADSGVQFEVEPELAQKAEVKPTPPELITSVQDVNIDAKVEPKDGKFDPAWKEPGVKYGDTPTGIPQPEMPNKETTPEKPIASSETTPETAKEMPVTTEDVARLMDAVEEARTFYAEVLAIDRHEQSLFSKVTALFKNVKRVPDAAIERAESVYREQLMLLQNTELERIKQSGLKGQELKDALAEGLRYFKVNEAEELYDAQTKMQLQAMERTKMGQVSQKIENFFRAYNKLSFTKKLRAAGGFAAAAVATGGLSVWASRVFSGMALATSLNVAGDTLVQQRRTKALEGELVGALDVHQTRTDSEELEDEDEADIEREIRKNPEDTNSLGEREVYLAYGRIPESEWTDEDRAFIAKRREAKEKERATEIRSQQVLKGEIPQEEWTPGEREMVKKYRAKEAEALYKKYSEFAERAIEVNTGRIEKWITNDKRRRWAVRAAAVAAGFVVGKLISEFVQSDTVKPLRDAITEKLSAGLEYFTEAVDQNTADSELQNQTVMFDESFPERKQAIPQPDNWPKDLVSQIPTEMTEKMVPGVAAENPGISPADTPTASGNQTMDSATSKLAQDMLAPEGRTPQLDEIVKDLKVSEAAAPETVAPGAISSKIEDILAHTAVKGDTLWDDSIKMAKGLGVEAGNEKAFAAKVEGAIRDAIEKDQALLSKIGFSETEFTRSDGEHLWLVEGKPVDYSSILTQEKLQEIVNGLGEAGKVPGASPEGIGVKPELTVAPETPSGSTSEVSGKGGVTEARPTFDGMDASGESVVANEASPRDSGKILEMRTVAQAPAPPLEAADIAALKESLSAEAVANTPATPLVSGAPKIGAETILAAKGSGATGSGARFVDAAMENSGSKKAPAGFVRAAAEMLTPEKLAEQYSAEKFDANQYISNLSPAEYEASRLKYNNLVRNVMVLQPGEVSPADFEQSERFRAYERAGMVGVFPAQSGNMKMSDIMEKFSKMEKGKLVTFGFSLEKSDLHPTHIKHLGSFVRENIRIFGVVGTPGKEERLAEYFARMLAISEKAPHLIARSSRVM